jgi:hypothetical protein
VEPLKKLKATRQLKRADNPTDPAPMVAIAVLGNFRPVRLNTRKPKKGITGISPSNDSMQQDFN